MFTLSLNPLLRTAPDGPRPPAPCRLIYRLRTWPDLPQHARRLPVLRMLSVMSSRPVSRHWMLMQSRLRPAEVDSLLGDLEAAGALEVIDPAGFARA